MFVLSHWSGVHSQGKPHPPLIIAIKHSQLYVAANATTFADKGEPMNHMNTLRNTKDIQNSYYVD